MTATETISETVSEIDQYDRDHETLSALVMITRNGEYRHVIVELGWIDSSEQGNNRIRRHMDARKDISISAQIGGGLDATETGGSYGWNVGLNRGSAEHPFPAYEIRKALKIIDKMERGAERIDKVAGKATTFGQFVARQFAALKPSSVQRHRRSTGIDASHWQPWGPGDLAWIVDAAVREARQELGLIKD